MCAWMDGWMDGWMDTRLADVNVEVMLMMMH